MILFRLWKVLLHGLRLRANSKTCQQVKKRMFTLHIWWWWWWCAVVVFVVDDDDAMCCATPHHTSQDGLCVSRFLNKTTTTTLVVANLRLGDWNESWSPRTEQNRTEHCNKTATKHWVGEQLFLLTTFFWFAFYTLWHSFSLTFSFFLLLTYIA